ncbi:MAG: DUF262 domain-containing protein [Verrucomicrobia bacterium]|nr:DUF262 domain-containing protein [Verrucomicrobiota bacterium]MCH8511935.1 DUF262 domain-containing protein [Kiritimatiellia bacterium]
MSTFDSTKSSLSSILKEICEGKVQLPDFQRGWVWDDDHIRDLLVSIARSFPVGAVMMLETGGNVKFQTRPVEGLENKINKEMKPEKLILDGQQRLTTLTQALALTTPVNTRTSKGKKIKRHYYFDIRQALANPHDLESAIIAVDENRQLRTNFGRDVELDLSNRELECEKMMFPCDQIMDSDAWEETLHQVAPENFSDYMGFRSGILKSFREYQIPVIQLQKETSKEAVCLVFEKVNTGGVQLSVFELITASYAADGYNLRDDWFGSTIRKVDSRQKRLAKDNLLASIEAPEFLQAITLLHTHERKSSDIQNGKTGKQIRPISAKRADVLELPLDSWKKWADQVEKGFKLAGRFLRKEAFHARKELPYRTQIVPLAAVMTRIGDKWLEPKIYEKLARWFWCGVLGELYGGAVETRIALDYEQLLLWFESDDELPRTIFDASFQSDRFSTLRSRLSAAYKGINVLVLREGAQDWFWKAGIQELDLDEVALDIHHIFPKSWCESHDPKIPRAKYDSILNKTPLSYKANRKISGDAPSKYLDRIQAEKHVQLSNQEMDELLESHALNPSLLRCDDFDRFVQDRRQRLAKLVETAMGKSVSMVPDSNEYEDEPDDTEDEGETTI